MSINKSAPPNVSVVNRRNVIYINGSEVNPTDGVRIVKHDTGVKIEVYDNLTLVWVLGSLFSSAGTIYVGPQIGLGDTGSFPVFKINKEEGKYFFPSSSTIDTSGTIMEVAGIRAISGISQATITSGTIDMDAVLDVSDNLYKLFSNSTAGANIFVHKQYLRVGLTDPTKTVRFRVYEDNCATDIDKLLIEMFLPSSF